ncbi:MAG: lipid-A-disaccharide synthase [Alphaproteobacteria bacterium]|nr:lipid-A-disaccharide synthase [Alphaproteobacteria bacterium]
MIEPDLRVFLIAGEPSGDRLGGALLAELKRSVSVAARGVGGADMLAEGLEPLFDMADLSVMGFMDVFAALPRLLWRLGQVVRAALAFQPDAVVFIDNQVFSQMAAARLRRSGYRGAVFLFVAPSVWAWKPERARSIAPLFDEVLAVLPFEPGVMAELGGPPTTYVGHPAERLIGAGGARKDTGLVALLPGSRGGELRRHLPVFRDAVARLAGHPAITGFVMPTLPHLGARLAAQTTGWAAPVDIVTASEARRAAFAHAIAALAGVGTITLELAMMDVPMVGTYVPDWLQMRAYRRWGRPLVALPNIVLSTPLVPEIAPGEGHAARVAEAVTRLIGDAAACQAQRDGFARVRDQIVNGLPGTGRQSAAGRILARTGRRIEMAGPQEPA